MCEEQSEDQGPELYDLARNLSTCFVCPTLAALLHDDDIFVYELFEGGVSTDTYNSEPTYFEDEVSGPDTPNFPEEERDTGPVGGDAARLCSAFSVPEAVAEVDHILHKRHDFEAARRDPQGRHERLAAALHLPSFVARTGYYALEHDVSRAKEPDWTGIPAPILDAFVRTPQK